MLCYLINTMLCCVMYVKHNVMPCYLPSVMLPSGICYRVYHVICRVSPECGSEARQCVAIRMSYKHVCVGEGPVSVRARALLQMFSLSFCSLGSCAAIKLDEWL